MNGQLEARRVGLGAAAVGVLILAMVAFSVLPASASHIEDTGTVQGNCVNFQSGTTKTLSSIDFPGVIITLNSWDFDGKGFTFTVSGLTGSQFIDTSVKSGQAIVEPGGYTNGTHHVSNGGNQNAISHVRLCVFGDPGPPPTEPPPTEPTTPTTIKDEVSPTSIVSTTDPGATTTDPGATTTDPEVSPETLPFTGFENGTTGLLALVLVASGALALVGTRVFREKTDE